MARRDPLATATLGLLRAFLDVARASDATARGRDEDARVALEAARARVKGAEQAPAGGVSLATHSDDVRAAIGALRLLLDGHG